MKKYVLIMILITIGLMAIVPAGSVNPAVHATPEAAGGNSTMVPGDAVYIMGYYAPYNLYVTAPTNISAPMITPFELNITAAGSARETFLINGAVISNSSFSNNIVIADNTSYTGYHNLTLAISSVNGKEVFHWTLNFMSPVTYLSYQTQKAKALKPGVGDSIVAGLVIGASVLTGIIYFVALPIHKHRIMMRNIKEGPRRRA